ncbi:hypothetical protein [Planotetraspora sp. GP83]|uniref:hypothetical protein n=1 Tax=Planotetraspora sp. GP83 TaxID=3156264 RepID=UPI0035172EA1
MPICTAVLAAALLSGPAATPVDQIPQPGNGTATTTGKQLASEAMKHPDDPDLIATKAMDILKAKGTKAGPMTEDGGSSPQDVSLNGDNAASGLKGNGDNEGNGGNGGNAISGLRGNEDNAATGQKGTGQPAGMPAGMSGLMPAGMPSVRGHQSDDSAADAWAYPAPTRHKAKAAPHRGRHAKPRDWR